jgi:hypothetical protein
VVSLASLRLPPLCGQAPKILRKTRDDEDSYTISPVITAIMTASVITELQQQFEQLITGGAPADEEVEDN